jgi:CheY-like chemotaxis protein
VNADRLINATRMILASPPGKMAGEAKMKLLNWVDGYISKPLKRGELLQAIENSLHTAIDLNISDEVPTAAPSGKTKAGLLYRTLQLTTAQQLQSVKPRILVAEDHFVNQKLFKTILERLGYSVIVASDGQEAVEQAWALGVDFIFMDVQMPRMNGYEATVNLRKRGFTKPIIAVTANAVKGDMDKCLQAGMDGYLSKPFTKGDVERVLQEYKQNAPANRPQLISAKPSDVPLYDQQKAISIFMDDAELTLTVVQEFCKRTPESLNKLTIEVQKHNTSQAEIIAHTLKGSAYNLTMMPFGALAAEMEHAVRENQWEQAEVLLPKMLKVWQETFEFCEKQIQSPPSR